MEVHGDGRKPVDCSWAVDGSFRTAGFVEFDLSDLDGVQDRMFTAIGPSKNRLLAMIRGQFPINWQYSRPIGGCQGTGKLRAKLTTIERRSSSEAKVTLFVKGSVPPRIGGPQFPIKFRYDVTIKHKAEPNEFHWHVRAEHNGFPCHELFIENGTGHSCFRHYSPSWFADDSAEIARPGVFMSLRGALALAGLHKYHIWNEGGRFPGQDAT